MINNHLMIKIEAGLSIEQIVHEIMDNFLSFASLDGGRGSTKDILSLIEYASGQSYKKGYDILRQENKRLLSSHNTLEKLSEKHRLEQAKIINELEQENKKLKKENLDLADIITTQEKQMFELQEELQESGEQLKNLQDRVYNDEIFKKNSKYLSDNSALADEIEKLIEDKRDLLWENKVLRSGGEISMTY